MNKFTEAKLEQAFVALLGNEDYPHFVGSSFIRNEDEVLIEEDLQNFLLSQYASQGITINQIYHSSTQILTIF